MEKTPGVEALVVDGGSMDGTVQAVRGMTNVRIEMVPGGKGTAIREAVAMLRSDDAPEYVVFTDGDYTYPAENVPDMIEQLEKNQDLGMVLGDRFHKYRLRDYLFDVYAFGNLLLRVMHRVINGVNLHDPLSGLRVMRWKAIEGWQPKSKGFDVEAEMNIHLSNKGWRIAEYPINYRKRIGKKKLKMRHGATILIRMIRGA